jgi:N-acetylneuraminic acid mutarotase
VFDPATGQFTKTGSMVKPRFTGHTATLLNDGRVLVVGGVADPVDYQASAEVYDPGTGSFSAVGNMAAPRGYHTATVLPNGKVLIAGGIETNSSTGPAFRFDAEIFDPATNTFVPGPPLALVYDHATATKLLDNRIFIVGGYSRAGPQPGSQLYDPASETFSVAGALSIARSAHTANLLPAGGVLIVGGETGTGPRIVPAEIYE